MILHVLSDLHLEFGEIELPVVDRDVLVLAGDIHVGKSALDFIEEQVEISPVIYVLGNHEFYHNDYDEIKNFWTSIDIDGLHVLENDFVDIGDIRFHGCVLWTDMKGGDRDSMEQAEKMMNDYHQINRENKLISASETREIHLRSVRWLESSLSRSSMKNVVVTHHLPTYQSVAEEFKGSLVNPAFVSDLDDVIQDYDISIWIHGHNHHSFDYTHHDTRIVCNPRGYKKSEENPNFNPELVIEL